MDRVVLFSCLLSVLFVSSSFQYGILRVEEIWSTEDIPQVKIEDMIIEESQLYIDYIEDLSGGGVTVEDILFSDGSITIPGNFLTCCGVEFLSALHANRGIFADAGTNSNLFSFTVEDNTGDVYVESDVRIQGGINASDRFFVDGHTGDTTIEGVTNANGGVFVNGAKLSLSPNGEVVTQNNVQVAEDVYFGEISSTSTRVIGRIPTSTSTGGTTYFTGQDAAESGGDIILEPGDGAAIGNIFLASTRNSDLFFGRTALSNSDNGGLTFITGQSSFAANGGDLFFDGGNSGAVGFGGDIILAPGLSSLTGRPGKLFIGSPIGIEAGHDIVVGRPSLDAGAGVGSGGSTTFRGQSTLNGIGGSYYLRAGDVHSGTGNPGDLILTPGVDAQQTQTVLLGKNTATQLNLRRVQTVSSGGLTKLYGQNATASTGGDLLIRAGGSGLGTVGGDLYLVPGSSSSGKSGDIVLGLATDELFFRRPVPTNAAPGLTTISGQEGLDGVGGDIFFVGGDGISQGGDVVVVGGKGNGGGAVNLQGGSGNALGGEVSITAGHGGQRNGGEISISSTGGPVTLSTISTGAPGTSGKVVIGPAAARLYVDEVPVQIFDAALVIKSGKDSVTISADPDAIVTWNSKVVLKQTQNIPVPTLIPADIDIQTIRGNVATLSVEYNQLLQALNQCGHGLVDSVTQPDNVPQPCQP